MIYLILGVIIAFSIFGAFLGCLTGLVPGFHVNNIALILLSITPTIGATLAFLTQEEARLLIAVFIVTTALAHTFINIIPATFFGVPEEDTAISVLPAHSLLLGGKGFEAVALSAIGSLGAVYFSLIVLFPIRLILIEPFFLYSTLKEIMPWVLIAISLIMIATEKRKVEMFGIKNSKVQSIFGMLMACFIFLVSGIFGLVISRINVSSPIGLPAPILFPTLAGLFGMPTLIHSILRQPHIPEQKISKIRIGKQERKKTILSIITGSLAGILVSIIPGITSATGTVLAMTARGETDKKQAIVTLSAVNTACAFFVVAVLFMILRPRSGAAIAVNQLITVNKWINLMLPPSNLLLLIIAMLVSSTISYTATMFFGRKFAEKFTKIPYQKLIKSIMVLLSLLIVLFTGVLGLLIFMLSTFIGLIPVLWGLRRSHCMGVLLLPIILTLL
jgi:putative membrane protein